jgi:APA family basic amino acid/polyamine antiporter
MSSEARTSETPQDTSPRVIGALSSMTIVIGSMLGIGIFLTPPIVARELPSALPFFGIWVIGALSALGGATACAALGVMMPRAGGDYIFQRRAYGPTVAIASGWVLFGAVFSGSIGAMSVPVAQFQLPVLLDALSGPLGLGTVDLSASVLGPDAGWKLTGTQLVGAALVVTFTMLNVLGTRIAAAVQTTLTTVPMLLLTLAALIALIFTDGSTAVATEAGPGGGSWMTAYSAVYFAFAGWNALIYVAGEVKDPEINLPLGLVGGTVVTTAVYLLLCVCFLSILGFAGLAQAGEAGTAVASQLGGRSAQVLVTGLIATVLLASINATIMGGGRVALAMARDGVLWRGFAKTNAQGVPARALWLQGMWAILLILTGSFEQILHLVSVAMMVVGSLTVASLFVLRRREPDALRAYDSKMIPWLPIVYLVSSLVVVVGSIYESIQGGFGQSWHALGGVILMLVVAVIHGGYTMIRRAGQDPGEP